MGALKEAASLRRPDFMKFGVIVFPGSNCDLDAYHMVRDVLNKPVDYIWHQEKTLRGADCIILPGGFTYGDYLRPGAIASFSPVMEAVKSFAENGGLVLGICNGFQVLVESGLLPGALYRNIHLQFRSAWAYLRVENPDLPYTRKAAAGHVLKIPVAHGDGNYYCDPETLEQLKKYNRIAFRYVTAGGEAEPGANPNGSVDHIAGICNARGNVLGMMPHPERAGEALLGSEDGRLIFESILEHWGESA